MDDHITIKLSKLVDLAEAKERQIHSLPPPEKCDLCSKDLSKEKYYIDGELKKSGHWANMCPKCFDKNGVNIGWGEGQLYMQEEKGSWLLVAGFSPSDEKDGSVCNFCGEEYDKKDLFEMKDGAWACQNCMDQAGSIMNQWIDKQKEES